MSYGGPFIDWVKYESKVDIWVVKNCSLALHKKLSRLSAILHVKISNISMSTNLKIGKKIELRPLGFEVMVRKSCLRQKWTIDT